MSVSDLFVRTCALGRFSLPYSKCLSPSQRSNETVVSSQSLSPSKLPSSSGASSPLPSPPPPPPPRPEFPTDARPTTSCSAYSFFLPLPRRIRYETIAVVPSSHIVPFPRPLRSARAPMTTSHTCPPLQISLLACLFSSSSSSSPRSRPSPVSVHLERIMALRRAMDGWRAAVAVGNKPRRHHYSIHPPPLSPSSFDAFNYNLQRSRIALPSRLPRTVQMNSPCYS